jgi:hypothetical protein
MESVPDGERSSRQEMMAAVDRYFDGILQSRGDIVPLSQGCGRRENGVLTANNPDAGPIDPKFPEFRPFSLSCAAQMFSGLHSYVSNVRRRHVLVDEEKGLLLGVYLFDHPGMSTPIEVAGVGQILAPDTSSAEVNSAAPSWTGPSTTPDVFRVPNSFLTTHLFKIRKGQIHHIEASVKPVPYGMRSGWE